MESLANSRFWRALAVLAVLSLVLVGYYGLLQGGRGVLASEAHASYIAVGPKNATLNDIIVTASPDGKTIYEWGRTHLIIRQSTGSCVQRPYVGLD
jgi:hypothetical protein